MATPTGTTLTPGDSATRLHLFTDDGVDVWLDTDIDERDGLCIGMGNTPREALQDALRELEGRCLDLRRALEQGGEHP
jgi:hypothetical protein